MVSLAASKNETPLALLETLFVPIIRFCLRHSIQINQILEAAKTVFIRLSAEELESRAEKVTLSRLSVMTGIHRRDVVRIHRAGEKKHKVELNMITRFIGQWEQDRRFQTAQGRPRVLALTDEKGGFEDLAKSAWIDVGPKTLLSELERIGAVKRVRGGVKLIASTHYQQPTPTEGLEFMAQDLESFSLAIEENLYENPEFKNLHIGTWYDNVYVQDLPKIRKWMYEQGKQFQKKARDYLSRYDKDINPNSRKEGGAKVSLVTFSWTSRPEED